jgi:hypothetical protein
MPFCVRCGAPLRHEDPVKGARRSGAYAAAPGEGVARVALVSTLLPQLPAADLDAFRFALFGGFAVLVALVAIGAYPVALVGAALLVPALVVLYVYAVDVYEETPLPVIGFTLVWGAAWGVLVAVAADSLVATPRIGSSRWGEIVLLGVLIPLVGLALTVAGPLILLRDRRFNDVVDGASFGVASAVAFVGAQVIAGSVGLFAAGPTPVGDTLPWIARILSIAIVLPVIAAGAVGSAVGAFSLRYRAPVRDRDALGIVGRPVVATVLAGVMLVASALAGYLPGSIPGLAVRLVVAAVALIWLRRTLHLGLLEEAFEAGIGDEITCANCGLRTPRHTFCGNCGIALHALPRRSSRADDATGNPAEPPSTEPPA